MNDVVLHTFPNNSFEALAMLYLQNQDLRGLTPSEIHTMYCEALAEIKSDYKEKRSSGYFINQ